MFLINALYIYSYVYITFCCCRVMVMEAGQIKEYDKPDTLLKEKDSLFFGMAKDAGLV